MASVTVSFLFSAEQRSIVQTDHTLFIHQWTLGCFYLLTIVNNAMSFFFFNIYLLTWLRRVSVAACGLLSCSMRTLSCSMHAGSSSLTRD